MGRIAFALGLALAFVSAASAANFQYGWVTRDWENPDHSLTARLSLGSGTSSHWVYVNLNIGKEAALRLGEVESFRVKADFNESAGGGGTIQVTVEPDVVYHSYPAYQWRTTYVSGGTSTSWVYFNFGHNGRIKVGAPPSVKGASVDYTTPENPLKLSFSDFAFAENGSAATQYKFSIWRRGFLGNDKLVARGIVDRTGEGVQAVEVAENGPYREGAEEWFQNGKSYGVYVRVKRTGTEWYADEFGDAFYGTFTWKNKGTVRCLKACSIEEIRRIEMEAEAGQQRSFETLYQD